VKFDDMLYDLEGELDSVKFTYQTMKDTIPESVTKDDFNSLCKKLIVEVLDEAGVSRASTISFLHKLLKSSFVTLSGMVSFIYITAYQTQYNQLGLHKVEPHPFGAMFIMLYDLEGELDSVKFLCLPRCVCCGGGA
jgi:hypothetical protein